MNSELEQHIRKGNLVLFLGAGASINSINSLRKNPPLGGELAETIAKELGWEYKGESLKTVFSAAKPRLGDGLYNYLESQYKHCTPSREYLTLASYPWPRVYTTNIDDAFEKALNINSKQKINIKGMLSRVSDKDQLLAKLDYIYLNGSVSRHEDGYVFTPEDYGKASAKSYPWYEELASDFMQLPFIFIGTKLDEPVFYHQVERLKHRTASAAPKSWVLTPDATDIEVLDLQSYGINYVKATLSDFVKWLDSTFKTKLTVKDVAQARNPELKVMFVDNEVESLEAAKLLNGVIPVSRTSLSSSYHRSNPGTIRDFYKGFKPTWLDVIESVPAPLKQFESISRAIAECNDHSIEAHILVGPAGSGKSTLLKMIAIELSDQGERVYFLPNEVENLGKLIHTLNNYNDKRFYVVIERVDAVKNELPKLFGKGNNAIYISAEGQNIWHNRVEAKLPPDVINVHKVEDINEDDVDPILTKLKNFGPWTRLAKLDVNARKREIYGKSRRQLLIGLMEATTGIGFEQIIQNDYEKIASEEDRFFFVLACLASMHKCQLSNTIASRSLSKDGIAEPPISLARKLQGIIVAQNDFFAVRHPLYARKSIESIVDTGLIKRAISALLQAFSVYTHPVIKSLTKNDADLFKAILNHHFLIDVLREDETLITSIYQDHEKYFEADGLFWLQYGLCKRHFGDQAKAYEILNTAFNAYPHDHTAHAYAQQMLILVAAKKTSVQTSLDYILKATKMLESLDDTLESDDTYPLVTLAEGHISALISLDKTSAAKIKAKEYESRISDRLRKRYDSRLASCKQKLLKLATTGYWNMSNNYS